jgi:hypothetical protein
VKVRQLRHNAIERVQRRKQGRVCVDILVQILVTGFPRIRARLTERTVERVYGFLDPVGGRLACFLARHGMPLPVVGDGGGDTPSPSGVLLGRAERIEIRPQDIARGFVVRRIVTDGAEATGDEVLPLHRAVDVEDRAPLSAFLDPASRVFVRRGFVVDDH